MSRSKQPRPITTEHLRLTYGLSPNNMARQSLAYVQSASTPDLDTYRLDFGNKQAVVTGILAYEAGTGDVRFECNCRKAGCSHPLAALWHRALSAEGLTADEWWEKEKIRRVAEKSLLDADRQMRRTIQEQALKERNRLEQEQREAAATAARELREQAEIDRIIADFEDVSSGTSIRFQFDPETLEIAPMVDGRPVRQDPLHGYRSGYGQHQHARRSYDTEDHPDVAYIRTLLSTRSDYYGRPLAKNIHDRLTAQALVAAIRADLAVLPDGRSITHGDPINADPFWETKPDGKQHLKLNVGDLRNQLKFFTLDEIYSIDENACLREVVPTMPKRQLENLFAISPLDPAKAVRVQKALSGLVPDATLPTALRTERRKSSPKALMELDEQPHEGRIKQQAVISFQYDWGRTKPGFHAPEPSRVEGDVLVIYERDQVKEAALLKELASAGASARHFDTGGGVLLFDDEESSIPFRLDLLPELETSDDWTVNRTPRWKSDLTVFPESGSLALDIGDPIDDEFQVSMTAESDGFDLDVLPALIDIAEEIPEDAGDDEVERILDRTIHPRGLIVQRPDTGSVIIPKERVVPVLRALWRFLRDSVDAFDGSVSVSRLSLADLALLGSEMTLRSGSMIARLVEVLTGLRDQAPTPLPSSFNAAKHTIDLAQQQGLDWMQAMLRSGFGGILADQVGVGKTLQLLLQPAAMLDQGLLSDQALIIVPKTAIGNWEKETAEFFPGLRAHVWEGPNRHQGVEEMQAAHVVLTTYPCVTLDAALTDRRWAFVGIDEAQDVRNPATEIARAIMELEADQKIPATGTPLENTLLDVWTLMQIANPGLLGPLATFRREVQNPIEKDGDQDVQRRLARFLRPFMLHRTRKEAGHDIPDPIYFDHDVRVEGAQARLYEFERLSAQREINGILAAKGFKRGKGQILTVLTRLRQICCHPRLVKRDYAREMGADDCSAKTEDIVEVAQRLRAEGKRILLFSQWTGHLDILADEFAAVGLTTGRIDGSMSTVARQKAEDQFKRDAGTDVLMITLGTGGKALNIPEADAVFIVDPWWNPQKEIQGIGRTQRRGQTKAIEVHRFIVLDSIETRIVVIQQRKLALADSIFDFRPPDQQIAFEEEDLLDMLLPLGVASRRLAA